MKTTVINDDKKLTWGYVVTNYGLYQKSDSGTIILSLGEPNSDVRNIYTVLYLSNYDNKWYICTREPDWTTAKYLKFNGKVILEDG